MVKEITEKVHACVREGFESGVGWKGSLDEFLLLMKDDPAKYMRTAVQFVGDMINYFGVEELVDCGEKIKHYKLFDDNLGVGEGVYGQDRMIMQLVSHIDTIAKGGGSERIFLLKGPVATAKTSIVRIIIKGAEEYSKTPEGGIYTFNWVFPMDKEGKKKELGFGVKGHVKDKCYAHLKRSDALANIPCQMNDSPLLLYPRRQRKEILEEIVKKSGIKVKIPSKIMKSELCFNCQTIYSRLLEEYSGDLDQVFKHVQVERLGFSEIRQIGCATIQPVRNTDGDAPIITMETESYSKVSDLLKGIELHKFSGKWVDANRGLIHYSDIFKRHGNYLQYLLSAVQEFIIDFNGVQGFVDVMIMGTTNLEDYQIMLNDNTNKGLMDRTRVADVGYILQPSQEAKIYHRQFDECGYTVKNDGTGRHIMPHVVEYFAMWNVMTRLKKPISKNYADKLQNNARTIITNMTPLAKAKLYDGIIYSELSLEEKLMLVDSKVQRIVRNEHADEGMEGISPRTMQNVVADIISRKETEEKKEGWAESCLSFHRIRQGLEELIFQNPRELEKIKEDDRGYGRFFDMIGMIEADYQRRVASEIRRAFVGITPEQKKELILKYLDNVESYITKQAKKQPDAQFMRFIEEKMGIKSTDDARSYFQLKVNDIERAINSGNSEMIVGKEFIYDELFSRLDDGLFEEKRMKLGLPNDRIYAAVKSFNTKQFNDFSDEVRETITGMFGELISRYGYCSKCAKDIVCEALEREYMGFKVKT